MLALVYIECVVIGLLTLGFIRLQSIGLTASAEPAWYLCFFLVAGIYSITSLWWMLIAAIQCLRKERFYKPPPTIMLGIWVGFALAIALVLYPWLYQNDGYVRNEFPLGLFLVVLLPCLIAMHVLHIAKSRKI